MPETCIVCLGDLSIGDGDAATTAFSRAKSPSKHDATPSSDVHEVVTLTRTFSNVSNNNASQLIAQIKECGHLFHQDCLSPWIERANSCPMCRASFNLVEVKESLDGPVVSTINVENRTQIAELDPETVFELVDINEAEQVCQSCGEDDREEVLMICDGCEKMWHTYCVGLQAVPRGAWFCETCRDHRAIDPRPQTSRRTGRTANIRTAGQLRRHRSFRDPWEESWSEVLDYVYSGTNLDLDFPYNEDEPTAAHMRQHRQRRNQNSQARREYERRLEIASVNGAGNSFRRAHPAFVGDGTHRAMRSLRPNIPAPQPTSMDPEEASAWAAFDQARAASAEPSASRRGKRKSRSASPLEDEAPPTPIVIKRRRTSHSAAPASVSSGHRSRSRHSPHRLSPPRRSTLNDTTGPSFLQSLLQEVEESSHASSRIGGHRPSPRNAGSPVTEQSSPRPSSPVLSPSPSTHSSPRAMSATPPPLSSPRPQSPAGLTSTIKPVYPTIEYSPRAESPPPKAADIADGARRQSRVPSTTHIPLAQPQPRSRAAPFIAAVSPPPTTVSPQDALPARLTMSLSAKSDVQKLVSTALKPHYNDHSISKDEYTNINRDVSRMLYDRIGDFETLRTTDKAKWEQVASLEVEKAVQALKAEA